MQHATSERRTRGGLRRSLLLPAALVICASLAAGQSAAPAPAAKSGPAPAPAPAAATGLNQWMPGWLSSSVEVRGRAELYTGLGFVPDKEDGYYLHRLRINTTVRIRPWLRTFLQLHDSRVAGYSRGTVPASMANSVDVRQAYVELGGSERDPVGFRLGRQALVFGDMRLVSTSNWGNVGPAYDGARFTVKTSRVRVDAFATTLVTAANHQFDRPRQDRRLHGLYAAFPKLLPAATGEAYFLWKHNLRTTDLLGRAGGLQVYTSGGHVFGKLPASFDYNVEMALQTGREVRDTMRAWAGHWEAGRTFATLAGKPRVFLEYNYATGDRDPADGRRRTFDCLYPTDKYGTADTIAWRNIHEPIANIEFKPNKKWKLKLAHHSYWLADRRDALYSFTGAVLARNPNATSSHVGSELDFRAIYQQSPRLQ
jgi:hypothetical protein